MISDNLVNVVVVVIQRNFPLLFLAGNNWQGSHVYKMMLNRSNKFERTAKQYWLM